MKSLKIALIVLMTLSSHEILSQIHISGKVAVARKETPLAFVNIGIVRKDVGTTSLQNGTFEIDIPFGHEHDTLTFSSVGYHEFSVPLYQVDPKKELIVSLIEKVEQLNEIVISGEKQEEKKHGIKKRGLVHFTDGIFKPNGSFEIGQVLNLGNREIQISSVNLYLHAGREDSASFRINFYSYDKSGGQPSRRILEKNILQRKAIREGWLRFELMSYDVVLKGTIFLAIEFIPENKEVSQIFYEVKIGGSSKSFFRRSSLGQWIQPPHHYVLFATGFTDKHAPEELEDDEAAPTVILKSTEQREPYSIFVRLPKNYVRNSPLIYPVIYHVDGNAFFDPISSSADKLFRRKNLAMDPIVVGIGYENAYVMDSLRDRDYSYPKALPLDSFKYSGEGALFYEFIKTKVKPYINHAYRTDTAHQTIMGHSLGGYFVLYALLKDAEGDPLFTDYVAASPSISYCDKYILKALTPFPISRQGRKPKLYLTVGELELKENGLVDFNQLGKVLSTSDLLDLKIRIYEGAEHMGTAILSFEDGMKFILGGKTD